MRYDASLKGLCFPELIPPVFKTSRTYDRIQIAAEAARLCYFRFEENPEARKTIESALRLVGFDRVEYFSGSAKGGHAMAALPMAGGEALVAFRGTRPTSLKDIKTDLDLSVVPWSEGGKVHEGGGERFEELRKPLLDWHERAGRGRLLITGHSLGAGLATLCATVLKPNTLVTLASPRVGDADFVSLFAGAEVHRFVNCCDVITRLPDLPGYMHIGKGRYLDCNGVELIDPAEPSIAEDQRRARWSYLARYTWRPGNVWVRDAADHAPINYVSAILGEREN